MGPYDIALMEVKRPFLLNPFVSTVSLPYPNTIPDGEAMLTGWGSIGRTRVHEKPGNLQAAVLPIIGYDVCKRAIARSLKPKEKNPLHPTNICTGPLNGSLSACKVLFNSIERTIVTIHRAVLGEFQDPLVSRCSKFQSSQPLSIQILEFSRF